MRFDEVTSKGRLSLMKTIIALAVLLVSQFAFADGIINMDFRPWNGRFLFNATHTGSEIKGSISPSRLSPFVRLTEGAHGWTGSLSQQVASVQVTDRGNGKYDILVSALPGGFYSYTYVTKSNGDIEVSGMGPTGMLNTAGLKKSASELYYMNIRYTHTLYATGDIGHYEGLAGVPGPNTGPAYLTADGDMAPAAASEDPALFVLLYVFPFSI
jgi:hypothetical protein